MSYVIRSSPIWWSDLRHAYVDFDWPILGIRDYIRDNFTHILDTDFIASISEVDRISYVSGTTRMIEYWEYFDLLDSKPSKIIKSAA